MYGKAENINICIGVKNSAKRSITVVDGKINSIKKRKELITAIASKISWIFWARFTCLLDNK